MRLLAYLGSKIQLLSRARTARECLKVLPVVRAQLQETSHQIEDSVVAVCGNFTGIAQRARDAMNTSTQLLDGQTSGPSASVESSIEASRRTIASLLERMERAAKLSGLAVSSMEEVSQTVTGIEELLGQVDRIAFSSKVVALNAKIEAVHVGQLGSGFEVVADEISRQAGNSAELSAKISSHIHVMRERVNGAAADLRVFLAEDCDKLAESRQEAEGALSMLWALHERTRESLERANQDHSKLASEVAAAIVGLQFQDRVKQRVQHVIEALGSLEAAVAGKARQDSASQLLSASYTMEAEREAHARASSQRAPEPQDMEVEIF